jgi:hypothetical protein
MSGTLRIRRRVDTEVMVYEVAVEDRGLVDAMRDEALKPGYILDSDYTPEGDTDA